MIPIVDQGEAGINTEQTSSSSSSNLNYLDYALWVCYVSIVTSVIAGVIGLKIGTHSGSSSTITYALEVLTNLASSILVAWRFLAKGSEAEAESREKRASIGIGCAFAVIGCVSSGVAISGLIEHHELEYSTEIITFHLISCCVMFPLAAVEFHIAKVVKSSALYLDAINTVAVSMMSVGVLTVTWLEEWNENLWFTDEALTLVVSCILLVYAYNILFLSDHKWWVAKFWNGSEESRGLLDMANPPTAVI